MVRRVGVLRRSPPPSHVGPWRESSVKSERWNFAKDPFKQGDR